MSRQIGEVILDLKNVSLSFGGVKALTDISFDVREHEIRAIIGPNGAGKSSMLNVINGVYRPQQGEIVLRGQHFSKMNPYKAAKAGISRTFQNIALFKGMNVIDNLMTGRNLKIRSNLIQQAFWWGPARREELAHRAKVEEVIDFPRDPAYSQDAGGSPALRPAEARRPRARAGDGAEHSAARRADGRNERRGEAGHVPLHPRRQ
jgi:branched-chain amino acid transport system ATP-binding protein